jgi:hypothetical protein
MDTQTAFVERRRTAQRAGTVGLDNDPLVVAIRRDWQDAQEVMARMRAYRLANNSSTAKV